MLPSFLTDLLTAWCQIHKTSGIRSSDGSGSLLWWVMVPVPFMYKEWLCFCTWNCFFQQHSPEQETLDMLAVALHSLKVPQPIGLHARH